MAENKAADKQKKDDGAVIHETTHATLHDVDLDKPKDNTHM